MQIDKTRCYDELGRQLTALIEGERDLIANSANMAALIFNALPDLNWAGFYWMGDGGLVLGPFQGKPACVRIAIGKGVCGTAARDRRTLIVPNVNEFPGHIACDADSRSELVVPIVHQGALFGVLDLDSPHPARFDSGDAAGCEALMAILGPRISG